MLEINISVVSEVYIKKLPQKQRRQIAEKIYKLAENPTPPDARQLRGYERYYRADIGEHRIIYLFSSVVLQIVLVGKRNDDEVYRRFDRMAR